LNGSVSAETAVRENKGTIAPIVSMNPRSGA
jgi:hypothetical protein